MRTLNSVIYKNSKRKNELTTKNNSIPLAGLAFIIVFSFFSIIMAVFSYTVTSGLLKISQAYAFINILFLMNFFILFTKSVFESLNVLYFAKDLRVLLRMPIKSKDILHAKFLNMIISEYQMETIMLAVPMIVYGILTKVNFVFYIYMIIVLALLPIIPIMITSLIISIIMRFTNFIKNKNKVAYITIIFTIIIASLLTIGMNSQTTFSVNSFRNMILRANGLAETISDYFILLKPIMNTMINYDSLYGLQNLLLYIIENILCYYIILNIIAKIYLKGAIGTTINSNIDKNRINNYSENKYKKYNKNLSYIVKEFKILLRSPIFCIQCLIMPVLDPIIILGIIFGLLKFADSVGMDLINSFRSIVESGLGGFIFLGTSQVFFMMNFSSIISVSREGKNAIILKVLPISLYKQFNLKITIGLIINFFTSALATITFFIFTEKLFFSFILLIVLTIMSLISEKVKLFIDLKNPQLDWNSEYTMMKQNTNVMYELFYTVVISGILLILSKIINRLGIYIFVCLILFTIINTYLSIYIKKHQKKLFKNVF